MERIISAIGRTPRQRLTTYEDSPQERRNASFRATELQPIVLTPAKKWLRDGEETVELVRNA
jgi:FO synthase